MGVAMLDQVPHVTPRKERPQLAQPSLHAVAELGV
jgi:hypothetical protein